MGWDYPERRQNSAITPLHAEAYQLMAESAQNMCRCSQLIPEELSHVLGDKDFLVAGDDVHLDARLGG